MTGPSSRGDQSVPPAAVVPGSSAVGFVPWQEAWQQALYGPDGFYRSSEGPAGHFRTAAHAAPGPLARALARLAAEADCAGVVDVGAGRGELVCALAEAAPALALHAVDLVPRPPGLAAGIGWSCGLDASARNALRTGRVLLVAWELLDVVPGPILEIDEDGVPRELLVQPGTGRERPGPAAAEDDLEWCRRWWPLEGAEPGTRAEVGRPRDLLWQELLGLLGEGLALTVDYRHTLDDRPAEGSLTGFRVGRQVPPVPNGTMDLTTHVALDSVAAAGIRAGATTSRLTTQREALRELGVGTPDPQVTRLEQLVEASRSAELLARGGFGDFGWLVQTVRRTPGRG